MKLSDILGSFAHHLAEVIGNKYMKPNAKKYYDPRSEYFRELVESTGLTQPELGKLLGCNERTIRRWLTGARKFPYTVQLALENLVIEM